MNKAWLVAALALGACAHEDRVTAAAQLSLDWRRVATPADRERLSRWRTAFVEGLAQAKASGHAADIAREGRLLEPDAAVAGGGPPAGDYRCRVIKLGAKGKGGLAYVTYPAFDCRIADEAGIASFRKLTGSQRPVGVILDGGQKLVFLGTLVLGDEQRAIDYGRDAERDMVGAIENLGDGRWRLILPYPHYESVMDVIELVPATIKSGS
ncbi:DUF4893 domain-containing protein [Sphingomonas sp.]|uniref:DUF4893 domain-containing protein n=1 Tax=Sphingomonas sp. TaxID=28214 RepID=UPI002DB81A10|nr:DUF4893 domain-containing protein [Sphingomonas sp.]HEU4967537.1 DUF4893 domain-containing protein [Sphingomonas sp.]